MQKSKISEVLMILSMFISLSSAKFNIWNLVYLEYNWRVNGALTSIVLSSRLQHV